jgi:hypothetical protein
MSPWSCKQEPMSKSPQSMQAIPLQDHRLSEDMNLRSHHSEMMFKSEMPTVNPVFHNHSSMLPTAAKTEERVPSPEQLEQQKDQDYTCHLDKWKPSMNCASSATPPCCYQLKLLWRYTMSPATDTLSLGSLGK